MKIFKEILDINNASQRIPLSEDGVVFLSSRDGHWFIYAMYTKKDFTGKTLVEVTQDIFETELLAYIDLHKQDPTIITMDNDYSIKATVAFSSYKAETDSLTIEEMLNLERK